MEKEYTHALGQKVIPHHTEAVTGLSDIKVVGSEQHPLFTTTAVAIGMVSTRAEPMAHPISLLSSIGTEEHCMAARILEGREERSRSELARPSTAAHKTISLSELDEEQHSAKQHKRARHF